MLVPDSEMPGGERVKILDFGIAKGVTENLGPAAEEYRTNTGMVLGTATYMAPEQCKGAGNVTAKADVYSLGVIMYRMCCGQLPFRAEGQGEVMAMHIFSVAKPLRDRDASIPEPMNDLVARMMSKEPADRPTMVQVVQDLDKMASTGTASNQPVVMMLADAPPETSGVSSTLSAALGQSGRMKALVGGTLPRKPRLWLGLLATAALVLIGLGVRFGVAKLQPAAPLQPSVVVWALNSDPPNAQVVRKKDGKELCRTPCVQEPELGVGRLQVIFRAPGFADEEVDLDEQKPFARPVKLRSQPESAPPAAQPTTSPPATAEVKPPVAPVPGSPGSDTTEPARPPGRAPDPTGAPTGLPTPPPRGPSEPGTARPGKQPGMNWPRRPGQGKTTEPLLTDDKIQIIQ